MRIAITGVTGNMGGYFLKTLNENPDAAEHIKILCRSEKKAKLIKKQCRALEGKLEIVLGSLQNRDACRRLVAGTELVFAIASVIPPKADSDPVGTVACNVDGAKALIAEIEALGENQPALVHISSVAVYGNRCGDNVYGRVGEPLVSGPFELYSATKILGEYAVLQSNVKKWAVLRQTGMLHYNMFKDNIKDGLMFHTPHLATLEWATVKDSATLLLNLLKSYSQGSLDEKFWLKVYNIGGGESCRAYGWQTYDSGFKIIGGGFCDFFKPWYNATRNFHGMWYTDSDELENYFHFRSQSCDDFWKEMEERNKLFKLGKLVPKGVISGLVIKPLLKDANSPVRWVKDGDEVRAIAYFGGLDKFEELKKKSWAQINLPNEVAAPVKKTHEQNVLAYGYDIDKTDEEITVDDLKTVAEAHAGKLLTPELFMGNMYGKLVWLTQDGEKFSASPYTVLRAGHWEHALYKNYVWEFDRLAKNDKIFARIWYDSHDENENYKYYFDRQFIAHAEKIK